MAETEVVGEKTAQSPVDDTSDSARAQPRAPIVTPPVMPTAAPDTTIQAAAQPTREDSPARRLTVWQRAMRSLLVGVTTLISVVLLAPIVVALGAALWALVTETIATLTIVRLIHQGSFLQTADAMGALSVASRVGFAAIGYLGLYCSLMALLAGLMGRGRGRLFIIPGALLTASALILFATSVALCWPLVEPLQVPRAVLVGVALYLTLDTVTLATLLVDARETRRRWSARRHRSRGASRRRGQAPEHQQPPALPPTLAGA